MAAEKVSKIIPSVKAQEAAEEEEEEIVCPQETLREKCKSEPKIENLIGKLQECNDRVNGKQRTTETCEEELFDYIHALDHCVAKTLWSKLK